jgi:hypothetical protein
MNRESMPKEVSSAAANFIIGAAPRYGAMVKRSPQNSNWTSSSPSAISRRVASKVPKTRATVVAFRCVGLWCVDAGAYTSVLRVGAAPGPERHRLNRVPASAESGISPLKSRLQLERPAAPLPFFSVTEPVCSAR